MNLKRFHEIQRELSREFDPLHPQKERINELANNPVLKSLYSNAIQTCPECGDRFFLVIEEPSYKSVIDTSLSCTPVQRISDREKEQLTIVDSEHTPKDLLCSDCAYLSTLSE